MSPEPPRVYTLELAHSRSHLPAGMSGLRSLLLFVSVFGAVFCVVMNMWAGAIGAALMAPVAALVCNYFAKPTIEEQFARLLFRDPQGHALLELGTELMSKRLNLQERRREADSSRTVSFLDRYLMENVAELKRLQDSQDVRLGELDLATEGSVSRAS